MKLNRHDYELIILGLSYLQLHLQKQYEDEKDNSKKDKIYYKHILNYCSILCIVYLGYLFIIKFYFYHFKTSL